MPYKSPVPEIRFLLDHVVGFGALAATGRFAEATPDLTDAILTEAARMCDEVLAPLQRNGDLTPARLENGVMRSSPGFDVGYRAIAEGGWVAVAAPPEFGGMGLPLALNTAVIDMMAGACLSLQLKPLLTQGQIEALEHHASDAIKAVYLPKLISGEWSGTMNLTEPQAGSDVGALRCKAEPAGDGSYAVTGQKIYISWGDSDLVSNVCHLVLARLPGAAAGTKGISLFLVPKFLPDADGNPSERNALHVVSLEHKMGLHGSPTCVMSFDGAKGWLVGAEHQGMAAMFTMMNNARLAVATQGVGVAEAALQKAAAHAADREQMGPIIAHPDVRRMLARMRAQVFAARAITLSCAVAADMARATGKAGWRDRAAFLTPVAKAYGTDTGCEVAAEAMQVQGGMGFIEETGAAQYYRDVRVTAIYEGTNGIQAMDLVGRKLADGGEAGFRLIEEVEAAAEAARASMGGLASQVWNAAESLRETTEALLLMTARNRNAGAVAYLRAFALVLGAGHHLRAALAGTARHRALAEVYISRLLPAHAALLAEAKGGVGDLDALGDADLVT